MIEIILYREVLNPQSAEVFNEALVTFAEELSEIFKKFFTQHEPDYFRSSPTWLALVGSGVIPQAPQKSISAEVEAWLQDQVAGFFSTL